MNPLSLGVHVGQQNATMAELVALWTRLDGAVDWISVWDHLYEAPPAGGTTPHFEAVATLGALASVTEQARIGCLMFCVPYRNPALLAKACVAIDHISGGRFEPGFGAGWHEPEFRAHGYDFDDVGVRFDMLGEGLEIISSMLAGGEPGAPTTVTGEHYRVDEVTCVPGPFDDRPMPLWTGGRGRTRTPENAARFCSGWNVPYVDPAEFRRLNDRLDAACEAIDRDPATLERSINLAFHLGATTDWRAGRTRSNRTAVGPRGGTAGHRWRAHRNAGSGSRAHRRVPGGRRRPRQRRPAAPGADRCARGLPHRSGPRRPIPLTRCSSNE